MTPVERLAEFLSHPAPGLVFGPHERAGVGRRVHRSSHHAHLPLSWWGRRSLKRLTSTCGEDINELTRFYRAHDGVALCVLHDSLNRCERPALALYSVSDWDPATAPWRAGGEMAWQMQDCPMYSAGEWRVIGSMPSEGLSLVLFFDGQYEGRELAGRMFCIGLDGYLGFEEELASSFGEFIRAFTDDPAAVFNRVGFTWSVADESGARYGDPVEAYLPDVRGHPDVCDWPRT